MRVGKTFTLTSHISSAQHTHKAQVSRDYSVRPTSLFTVQKIPFQQSGESGHREVSKVAGQRLIQAPG